MAVRLSFVAALIVAATGVAALGFGQAGGAAIQLMALEFDAAGNLYAADSKNNQLVSFSLAEKKAKPVPIQVPDLGAQLAKLLGCPPADVLVHDVAVHPVSYLAYLSAGKKGGQESRLFRVGPDKKVQEVPLGEVKMAAVALPAGTQVLDLALTAKDVIVSSTNNDRAFGSGLHRVALPLAGGKLATATTEVYHTSHKAWETRAPLISVTAFSAGGKEYLLGSTKCTPVVRIPVDEIGDKAKVKTTTIIELGGRNGPVTLLVYGAPNRSSLLVTHNNTDKEGAYKVSAAVLAEGTKVNEQAPNRGGSTAETVAAWKNTKRAAALGPALAVAVIDQAGTLSLATLPLP